MNVIAIEGLRYSVRPNFWAKRKPILRGVDVSVAEGEIFGFLGPNGAGKTTTLKAMLGLLQPDAGQVRILGGDPKDPAVRRRLGFMPERAYFPEHLSARELLVAHGVLSGLCSSEARRRAAETIARVGLRDAADERLRGFSKGMQQRVGLGQALIGAPELVVLDEPMSGLDPIGRHDVREIMLGLKAEGRTVFFSTHILPDVEAVCDRVAILVGGEVRRLERLDELLSGTAAQVDIVAEGPNRQVFTQTAATLSAANQAIDRLRAQGATIVSVQTQRRSLEEVFVAESQRRTAEDV